MFKKILMALLGLIAVYLVLCIFGPGKMDITTTQTISGTPAQVYGQLVEFRQWPLWSKWIREDSAMKLSFGNPSYGVGGSYSWTSEKSGSGSMKITEAVENQLVKADLVFSDWNSTNKIIMELKPHGDAQTDLTWTMLDEKPFPFVLRGMMLVMNMKGRVKKDFDKGLSNLDELIKSGKAGIFKNGYLIHEGQYPGAHYLGKRATVSFKDISTFFGTHLPEIGKLAGPKITGAPCGLFWNYDEKKQQTDMAAAMPVSLSEFLNDTYSIIQVPASKEFVLDYYGAYDKTQAAYAALDSVTTARGYAFPQQVIEEYLSDPGFVPDTAKWLTRIHFLVK